jgi:hypothetical protein
MAQHPLHKKGDAAQSRGATCPRGRRTRASVVERPRAHCRDMAVPTCRALLRPDMACRGRSMASTKERYPELSRAGVPCILLSHQSGRKFGWSNFSGALSV